MALIKHDHPRKGRKLTFPTTPGLMFDCSHLFTIHIAVLCTASQVWCFYPVFAGSAMSPVFGPSLVMSSGFQTHQHVTSWPPRARPRPLSTPEARNQVILPTNTRDVIKKNEELNIRIHTQAFPTRTAFEGIPHWWRSGAEVQAYQHQSVQQLLPQRKHNWKGNHCSHLLRKNSTLQCFKES